MERATPGRAFGWLQTAGPADGSVTLCRIGRRGPVAKLAMAHCLTVLNDIERALPAGKLIEAVVDNHVTHKHPGVETLLEQHP